MIQIEVIRSEERWGNLAEPWNKLLDKSITDVPFLRHEFLFSWWQHRGGGEWTSEELMADSIYILIGRDDAGEMVGALPLFLSKNRAGKTSLVLMGSVEIADFLDGLALPEWVGEFWEAVLHHLAGPNAPEWDSVELFNLLESSPSLESLSAAAHKIGLEYSQEKLQPAPFIPLPGDFETYLENLDGRYRRELVRKMRNAQRYFIPVQVERVEGRDELVPAMEDFFAMMLEEPDKARFLTAPMRDQMLEIVRAAADHGWLDLRFLLVGRDRAAGYLNFIYGGRAWVYNSARADKFSSISPGIALMGMLIEEAIEDGLTAFDLMRGDEDYKYQLGGQDRWVVKVTLSH
jgi:CelD/BcsL family acetyltransferase involved in cellulose biosynthesis